MSTPTQIGWYNLQDDEVFHYADYECATWYENIAVPKGRYPIEIYDIHNHIRKSGKLDGWVYITMPGTIVSDYFGTLFCGMPIGGYDNEQNKGKKTTYKTSSYLFSIAKSIAEDENTPYELFPEYEAKKSSYEYNGEYRESYGIYRKIS